MVEMLPGTRNRPSSTRVLLAGWAPASRHIGQRVHKLPQQWLAMIASVPDAALSMHVQVAVEHHGWPYRGRHR